MGFLDWLLPGGGMKAELSVSIGELTDAARRESERQGMPPRRALIWDALCGEASGLLNQLLIRNTIKEIDWGLKGRTSTVTQPRLLVLYWWMLLYQLVLFRNRGIDGYTTVGEDFSELSKAAHTWVDYLVSVSEVGLSVPGPWEDRWHTQVSLEAALSLYNRVAVLLEMNIDPNARVLKVSHFTTATERAYNLAVQGPLAERLIEM